MSKPDFKRAFSNSNDAFCELIDRYKDKRIYNRIIMDLRFFWMDAKRTMLNTSQWKSADGDDLPEIDREVIALTTRGKVVFAHRPVESYIGKDIFTGKKVKRLPARYGVGQWNTPDILWWLDVEIPKIV